MKEVYDNGEKLAEYRHSPGGMLLSQRHGPLQVSYGYDRDKNLTALKALSGDEILADNLYEYDGNGNRTKKRQMEGETQYIYDGLNQLTKIEYPTLTEELFYDKAGNRTCRIAGDEEDLYSYDPRNRLVSHITEQEETVPNLISSFVVWASRINATSDFTRSISFVVKTSSSTVIGL